MQTYHELEKQAQTAKQYQVILITSEQHKAQLITKHKDKTYHIWDKLFIIKHGQGSV